MRQSPVYGMYGINPPCGGGNWRQRSLSGGFPWCDWCHGFEEALWAAVLSEAPKLIEEAVGVLSHHQFDGEHGLWHRWKWMVERFHLIRPLIISCGLPHLCGKARAPEREQCERFMDKSGENFEVMKGAHSSPDHPLLYRYPFPLRNPLSVCLQCIPFSQEPAGSDGYTRDLGYHAFNLIALRSLLLFPQHRFTGVRHMEGCAVIFAE